jgi:hypothetical protein
VKTGPLCILSSVTLCENWSSLFAVLTIVHVGVRNVTIIIRGGGGGGAGGCLLS